MKIRFNKRMLLIVLVLLLAVSFTSAVGLGDDGSLCFTITRIKHSDGTVYSGTNTTHLYLYSAYSGGSITAYQAPTVQFDNGTAHFCFYNLGVNNYTTPTSYLEIKIDTTTLTPRFNISTIQRFNTTAQLEANLDSIFQDDIGADCSAGDFVKGVDNDGTLDCSTPAGTTDTNASTACDGTTTYLDGDGNCDDISGEYVQADTWTSIDNYPSACAGSQFVQGLGDTLSCATPTDTDTTVPQWPINTTVFQNTSGSLDLKISYLDTLYEALGASSPDLSQYWNTSNFTVTNMSYWSTSYGWGDHRSGGYINSTTKIDNASYADDCGLLNGQSSSTYLDDTTVPQWPVNTTKFINNSGNLDINNSVIQNRVSGTCTSQVMVGINEDGTVSCEADDTGGGGGAGLWQDDGTWVSINTTAVGGTTANATTFTSNWQTNITNNQIETNNITVSESISMSGDSSTYIKFLVNNIYFYTQGVLMLDISKTGNAIEFNPNLISSLLFQMYDQVDKRFIYNSTDGNTQIWNLTLPTETSCTALETNANGEVICGTDDGGNPDLSQYWNTSNFTVTNMSNWDTAYGWGDHTESIINNCSVEGSCGDVCYENTLGNGTYLMDSTSFSGDVTGTYDAIDFVNNDNFIANNTDANFSRIAIGDEEYLYLGDDADVYIFYNSTGGYGELG